MISGQNNGKTHTKQMEKRLGMGFLSSTQQCSICNQFQGFPDFLQAQGENRKRIQKIAQKSIKNWGKTLGMLLKCSVFWQFQVKTRGMIAKNYQNPSKTMAKTKKTSAKQMEKGWGLHFSAMLNLQHISEFFLTFCRVTAEKGENEAKK